MQALFQVRKAYNHAIPVGRNSALAEIHNRNLQRSGDWD